MKAAYLTGHAGPEGPVVGELARPKPQAKYCIAPDLSGRFEFNLQGGGGGHWFLQENVALTLEAHYIHWSCAGIHEPNLGLNGVTGMPGVTYFL